MEQHPKQHEPRLVGALMRYPWRDMAVRDWFIVPAGCLATAKNAASYQKRAHGRVFTFRKIECVRQCVRVA